MRRPAGRGGHWRLLLFLVGVMLPLVLTAPAAALKILSGDRLVSPTIVGEETRKQISILARTELPIAERAEALRVLGGVPPSEDVVVLPILIEAIRGPEPQLRVVAAKGLGNLAAITDEREYRSEGGTLALRDLRERAVDNLVTALTAAVGKSDGDLASATARGLAGIVPTRYVELEALVLAIQQQDFAYLTPQLDAARALIRIAENARRLELTDWIPYLKDARRALNTPSSFVFTDDFRSMLDSEIVALENTLSIRQAKETSRIVSIALGLAGAAHSIFYICLIMLARWHEWAFRLLFDPVFSKLSIFFYPILRYFWPLQRWLFERYFSEVRSRLSSERPYLPMPVSPEAEDRDPFLSDALLAHWMRSPFVWVQGRAGMGKTALVRDLERRFFADPQFPTLTRSCRRYPFVPIVAAARDFAGIAAGTANPEEWLLVVAQQTLAGRRMAIEDKGLVKALLASGHFGIVLDGLNEVERDDAVARFAATMPNTPLLVTSQRLPKTGAAVPFEILRLPGEIATHARLLLQLYLGEELGGKVAASIASSGLLAEVKSGYDIALVVSHIESGKPLDQLPANRAQLYRSIIDNVSTGDGAVYRVQDLEALAWDMMLKSQRRFNAGALGSDLLDPLLAEGRRVLRQVGDREYEFRHDQMRAYLAARFLVESPASIEIMQRLLEGSPIWDRHRAEQEELWTFLAAEIASAADAQHLWRFAVKDVRRVVLQHALQETAEENDWQLTLAGGVASGASASRAEARH